VGRLGRLNRHDRTDDRMAVAYVANQMREPADDNQGLEIVMAAYDGLKGLRA
jgi:hypothetical protein